MADKRDRINISYEANEQQQQQHNNDDMPQGTKEKVYSAVVSPKNKCCLMMPHVWRKHKNNECT
jgi:phosphoribosylformylglycinamidine (FGAM) synthase-like amidotransferase family enzyme